jgi:hypothetical protein
MTPVEGGQGNSAIPAVRRFDREAAITPRALSSFAGGYPAALKRFATSGQLTTFHQASM